MVSISQLFAQADNLFELKLNEYVTNAKELSKKHLKEEDVSKLADIATSIIDDMKTRAVFEKLKSESITLKYLDKKAFPDLSEHKNNNENDQKIVKFTIASYTFYKKLSKDLISKIIQKSPLEMVSIIRELDMFFKFISANPTDFGHGIFTEKYENTTTIFATNDAILRIMNGLIYRDLLGKNKVIYRMSRMGSKLCNMKDDIDDEKINEIIDSLKRNTGDDSRISIYMPQVRK